MGKENAKQRRNRTHAPKRRTIPSHKQKEADVHFWSSKSISLNYMLGLIAIFVIVSVVAVILAIRTINLNSENNNGVRKNTLSDKEDVKVTPLSERNDTEKKPSVKSKDVDGFASTIHNILHPLSMEYNGRRIQFNEIKHENKKSTVHVYIADDFLSHRECDGLTAAHLNHVRETSKKSPIVCFAGVQTMNKFLHDIGVKYTGSVSDFTTGTLCVNESFSRSLSPKLNYSRSTAFYRGDNKFSELFEEQVEKITGLSKVHGGKFQITSYDTNVGYKTHTDCTEDDEIRDRFATILVYLQDVKEGGETKFPMLDISVKPVKGRALVWNNMRPDGSCDPTSIHNAAKVVNGRKVILQRWYYYKNFPTLGKAHPEPELPIRQQFQPRISCDQYDQGSCRWYDEWGYDHLVEYNMQQHNLS